MLLRPTPGCGSFEIMHLLGKYGTLHRTTSLLLLLVFIAFGLYVLYNNEPRGQAGLTKQEDLHPSVFTPSVSSAVHSTNEDGSGTFTGNSTATTMSNVATREREGEEGLVVMSEPSIVIICCNASRLNELRVLLKSVLIFGQDAHVTVRILANEECESELEPVLSELQQGGDDLNASFRWEVLPAEAMEDITSMEAVSGRYDCAAIRLFLPDILPQVDTTLYLNLDTIILSNLTEMWLAFEQDHRRSPNAVVGVTEHVPPPALHYYMVQKRVPFFGHSGADSGVIFMNLARMRELSFSHLVEDAFRRYKDSVVSIDVDILNIVLAEHPGNASVLDCTYNFNPTNCGWNCLGESKEEKEACFCTNSNEVGVKIIQAYGPALTDDNVPLFRTIHENFLEIKLNSSHPLEVITELSNDFLQHPRSTCFTLTKDALYLNALKYLEAIQGASAQSQDEN